MRKKPSNPRRSTKRAMFVCSLIGCVVGFGLGNSHAVLAECGSYVTIGNKAKLRELQAKGYLPTKMNEHDRGEITSSRKAQSSETSDEGQLGSIPTRSIPHLPCSGPNCRGQLPSPVVPQQSIPAPTFIKPIVVPSGRHGFDDNCVGFAGYTCFDEAPFSTIKDLDRPPE